VSRDFFNSRAATWDEKAVEKDVSRLEAMAARLDIKTGATVLDVGTGTGVFVPYILKRIGRAGNLVCLDYAGEMLKMARAKGFEGNIGYVCADIEDSRLPDKSFDAVVCYSAFPHFQDKAKALKEINRLLKPGGRLFICHTSGRQAINKIHRSLPEVCDHLFPENGEMNRLLSGAGFEDICISDGRDDYLASARKAG
jgi:ubiquinone/menaquinone biosynthesis C-methylase UbiE